MHHVQVAALTLLMTLFWGCSVAAPSVTQSDLVHQAEFEKWLDSKVGKTLTGACIARGRNEACGRLVEVREVEGSWEQVYSPVDQCLVALREAKNQVIAAWRYVSAPEKCWVALPAQFRVTPYVDPRVPTGQDIAQAQAAFEAYMPGEHREYVRGPAGYGFRGNQSVQFSTSPSSVEFSRFKKVVCTRSSRDTSWGCYGPTTFVFVAGHAFPQPKGIDDQTIAEIVAFADSPCMQAQAKELIGTGKWIGPPLGFGRVSIRSIETSQETFTVVVGGDTRGNNLGIARSREVDGCRFRLYGSGYYIRD